MGLTQVNSGGIEDDAIVAAAIADNAVVTAAINADAVTGAKIADDAVGAEHIETLDANLVLADDVKVVLGNNDDFSLYHAPNNNYIDADTGTLHIRHSTETGAKFIKNGAVELYYDDSKKIETTSNGIAVSGGCITTFGQNTTHEAASIKVGYEGSSKGQIRVYGADASTTGSLELNVCESDGTDPHTVTVKSNGNLEIGDGDLVIETAGHGINFHPHSGTANLLDDYEEGTFTPTVHSGMNNSTLSTSDGSYTKIGRLVTYQLNMTISGGTANSSQLQFGGLPFAANGTTANAYGGATLTYQDDMFNKGEDITFHTGSGETLIKCYKQDGAALVGTDGAIDDITTQILLHGQYYT